MDEHQSVGVLIPTRNCGSLLPGHIDSITEWIDLAREVVVVDSDSTDGTIELLKKRLSHPSVKFLNHPPGLYQSWNFGLRNVGTEFVYIATVGDSITRAGLEHLLGVAREFQCDVAISKPRAVDAEGNPLPVNRWPLDEALERLNVRQPRLLSPVEQFLFAGTNFWGTLLGSSASNLYRTKCLQERPFPAQFGIEGDGAWGILNALDVKMAVTPSCFSTFRHHEKAYSKATYHVESLALKLFRLTQSVVEQQRSRNPAARRVLEDSRWSQLEPALNSFVVAEDKLKASKLGMPPWFLRPAAWQARLARNHARRQIDQLMDQALKGTSE